MEITKKLHGASGTNGGGLVASIHRPDLRLVQWIRENLTIPGRFIAGANLDGIEDMRERADIYIRKITAAAQLDSNRTCILAILKIEGTNHLAVLSDNEEDSNIVASNPLVGTLSRSLTDNTGSRFADFLDIFELPIYRG